MVDDDRAIRDSLDRLLALEGHRVTTAADGATALDRMRSGSVDLLVLDLMMPTVDGLTVCRVLRAEGDRVPILMLTARTETSDRVAGSTPARMTTCPSRSTPRSCWPGCGRSCVGPDPSRTAGPITRR